MCIRNAWRIAGAMLLALGLSVACSQESETMTDSEPVTHWVYFGTGADHVYVADFDAGSGRLGTPREATQVGRPGFLAVHPGGEILYAVGREAVEGSPPEGFAVAYSIDRTSGDLTELNRVPTAGRGASHVAVNDAATALAAVNYGDGNTVSLSLEPNGRLGSLVSDMPHEGSSVNPERQGEPHPIRPISRRTAGTSWCRISEPMNWSSMRSTLKRPAWRGRRIRRSRWSPAPARVT